MLLPPPNVTGALHIGHATMLAVQDSLARWFRMNGHKVEWRPGTDHAGIATQSVVEKHLAKTRGVDRHQLGREGLIKEIEEWRKQYGGKIHQQMVGRSWNLSLLSVLWIVEGAIADAEVGADWDHNESRYGVLYTE